MDCGSLRRTLLVALGLVACGPEVPDAGEGGGSDEGMSSGNLSGTGGSGTVESGSTTTTGSVPTTSGDGGSVSGGSVSVGSVSTSTSSTSIGEGDGGVTGTSTTGQVQTCTPILQPDGTPSGFERCDDGTMIRTAALDCAPPERDDTPVAGCDPDLDVCSTDLDCNDAPNGTCQGPGFDGGCYCDYSCETDGDCGDGQICACAMDIDRGPARPRCIPAECLDDADCGGSTCELGIADQGCGREYIMACRTANDECGSNLDCDPSSGCFPNYDDGTWQCTEFNCAIGRPFLVEGDVHTAGAQPRNDWQSSIAQSEATLTDAQRQALRDHWLEAARMEHASVASFARFVMQLMSLGAPPQLLRAAGEAMNDEVDHAQRCFALASRYGGQAFGPAPLAMERDIMGDTSFMGVLEAVIREACIGETLATLEASVALAHASDPDVRSTLEVIVRDEGRHAALGWQTLRWALEGADEARVAWLASTVDRALGQAQRDLARLAQRDSDEVCRQHGLLFGAERRRVLQSGLDEVVRPVAQALLADHTSTSEALRPRT